MATESKWHKTSIDLTRNKKSRKACLKCPWFKKFEQGKTDSINFCVGGYGLVPAEVMIVGEAPGWPEANARPHQLHPFMGDDSYILDFLLKKANLTRRQFYITNAIKCKPLQYGKVPIDIVNRCATHLWCEIEMVQPKLIIALGADALKALTGRPLSITQERGFRRTFGDFINLEKIGLAESNWLDLEDDFGDIWIYPMRHPHLLYKDPRWLSTFKFDFKEIKRLMKKGFPDHNQPPKAKVTTTIERFEEFYKAILKAPAYSVDTETTSTSIVNMETLCISFSWGRKNTWVVPLRCKGNKKFWQSNAEKIIRKKLNRVFRKENVCRIAQNFKFDYNVLRVEGFGEVYFEFDTMTAHHIVDECSPYDLENVANFYGLDLGYWPDSIWKYTPRNKKAQFADIPDQVIWQYTGTDAWATWELGKPNGGLVRTELEKNPNLVRLVNEVTFPLSYPLADMEYHGVKLDIERIEKLEKVYQRKLKMITGRLRVLANKEDFNPFSPKQVIDLLFNKLKMTPRGLTPGRQPKTDADVLEIMLREERSPKKRTILRLITLARSYRATISRELQGLRKLAPDGNVRTTYLIPGTRTGRLSSIGPDLQNIKRGPEIRNCFTVEDDSLFGGGDYKAIELRQASLLSGDPEMLNIFEKDIDFHTFTTAQVRKISEEEVTYEQRARGKAVVFGGIMFGRSIQTMADEYDLPYEEVEEMMEGIMELYHVFADWREANVREAREKFYLETAFWKRVRHFPAFEMIADKRLAKVQRMRNQLGREFKRMVEKTVRECYNFRISSPAADWVNKGIIRLHERLREENLKTYCMMQVHDALYLRIFKKEVLYVRQCIKEEMETTLRYKGNRLKLEFDIEMGRCWDEKE
jgi:DNA polymerase-1